MDSPILPAEEKKDRLRRAKKQEQRVLPIPKISGAGLGWGWFEMNGPAICGGSRF